MLSTSRSPPPLCRHTSTARRRRDTAISPCGPACPGVGPRQLRVDAGDVVQHGVVVAAVPQGRRRGAGSSPRRASALGLEVAQPGVGVRVPGVEAHGLREVLAAPGRAAAVWTGRGPRPAWCGPSPPVQAAPSRPARRGRHRGVVAQPLRRRRAGRTTRRSRRPAAAPPSARPTPAAASPSARRGSPQFGTAGTAASRALASSRGSFGSNGFAAARSRNVVRSARPRESSPRHEMQLHRLRYTGRYPGVSFATRSKSSSTSRNSRRSTHWPR